VSKHYNCHCTGTTKVLVKGKNAWRGSFAATSENRRSGWGRDILG